MNEEMLHAYMDGELTAAEVAQVERMLASDAPGDAHWAAEYEMLLAVDASVGELPGFSSQGFSSSGLASSGLASSGSSVEDDGRAWAHACIAQSNRSVPVAGSAGGRLLRMFGPLVAAAAALALIVLSGNEPEATENGVSPMVFSVDDQIQYLYWETDSDTFGSGDLHSLENEILAALETG
jgi:anti-sigma factor RsiW